MKRNSKAKPPFPQAITQDDLRIDAFQKMQAQGRAQSKSLDQLKAEMDAAEAEWHRLAEVSRDAQQAAKQAAETFLAAQRAYLSALVTQAEAKEER